jgi:Virulence-associated protein E-like domain
MHQRNLSASVPQPALDVHQIPVTFFDDKFAFVKYEDALTLPDLAEEIRLLTDTAKKKLPWLKLARFGDTPSTKGCLRTNENLLEITGVEIDYDAGETSFDQAVERLAAAGLRALVYTSASHKPGVREKWRVLCPTSQPLPPEDRTGLVAVLNGVLGGGIDPASFNLSIAFYYGSVNDNPDHRVEVIGGDFINLRPDLEAGAIGKPAAVKRETLPINQNSLPINGESPAYSDADLDAMLDKSQYRNSDGSGNWHPNMVAVTASLVSRGWGDDAIRARAAPFADGGVADEDVQKLIDGARAKWGIPDPDVPPGARLGPEVLAAISAAAPVLREPDWRERYVNGNPKASFHNTRLAIEALGIECSEDTFHGKLYIGRNSAISPNAPNWPFAGQVTDASIGMVRACLSDTWGLDFGERNVRDVVNLLCRENAFDPVVDMLAEAEAAWDGKPRLDRMAVDHFNAADTPLNRACVRKTMIAAVARARQPGCKFDTITVLEAPEGWNKSSAWAVLAGEGNFSDESILGKAGREVQEQLAGIWIHENAELAGITKAEVEVIKAFASRQVDRARPAYGHFLVEQPRHSIEVGTTNPTKYLLSQTGNRRFWPVEVKRPIDLKRLRESRLQLWGEAAHYQSQGEVLALPEALWAAAGVEQEERRVHHPWEAKLAAMTARIDEEDDPTGGWGRRGGDVIHVTETEERVSTADIFDRVLGVPSGQLNNGHAKTVASIMRMQGWANKPFLVGEKTVRGYVRTKLQVITEASSNS